MIGGVARYRPERRPRVMRMRCRTAVAAYRRETRAPIGWRTTCRSPASPSPRRRAVITSGVPLPLPTVSAGVCAGWCCPVRVPWSDRAVR